MGGELEMRLSESLRNELYLERLREKLIKLYSYGDAEPEARRRLLDQIDGYFEAAILMQMMTKEALQAVIDEEHMSAFGMTLKERKIQKKLDGRAIEVDWEVYDAPPSLRPKPAN
jgi:hypothetical protein